MGGLFRKFSASSRSGAAQHPFDSNEAGPPVQPVGHGIRNNGPLSNAPESNNSIKSDSRQPKGQSNVHPHLKAVDALVPSPQDKNSRSSSPMRNMILNGQMLD
ncbi:hypothetical protein BGZ65_010443 [Modicella reniformis]|uniref:Uncharacterized protein n=1 Tax=Modicella reniformis TaxID=1440133 RepID=A0A9P6IS05_9FUNG|nr:hypothetical protein BGZ65_010443 [Modicella reniformis]